jgi:plastocyanin
MKKKLLLVLVLAAASLSAQTTHHINWFLGVTPAQASMTIDQGDTVMWTWTDTHPHNVISLGGSAEDFESTTMSGAGSTFSHLFTTVGSDPYMCGIHASMQGTITVQSVMGVKDNNIIDFQFYPNPVTDVLTISAKESISRIQIYDMQGKLVMDSPDGNLTSKIYMSNYNAGTYLVKVTVGKASKSITVVKQ